MQLFVGDERNYCPGIGGYAERRGVHLGPEFDGNWAGLELKGLIQTA